MGRDGTRVQLTSYGAAATSRGATARTKAMEKRMVKVAGGVVGLMVG